MEVLNQNQRRSAYWRSILLTFIALVVLVLVLSSVSNSYTSQGTAEVNKMQKEHEMERKQFAKEKQGLEDDIKQLNIELKECREDTQNPKLKNCFNRLDKKEKSLTDIKNQLDKCENNLQAAKSF